MTDQLFTGSYPSDALTEAKQLRAENETLRRDYGLMQIDRNNLRSLLDATEAKVDELHDKLDDAQSEAKALRARVQELEAFAQECASYTCTCHEAYVGRQMVDPSCMAGEIGHEAQELLGRPVTCRGILAARPRWAALRKQEGGE